jgi:enediyne biosynthesis protein E5
MASEAPACPEPGRGALVQEGATASRRRLLTLDNRYLPPLLITSILLGAHLSYGILEAWHATALSIVTAIVAELVMGRITYGKWPHPASAYISGISAGILVRSTQLWPYFLVSLISITSKYVLRVKDRHIWNPTNFGVSAAAFLAPATITVLSVQWGNVVTGPMYQLFIFFMVTDPKTTVRSKSWQCVVVFVIAFVEMILRLNQILYAPFYALFIVGPIAMLIDFWSESRAR